MLCVIADVFLHSAAWETKRKCAECQISNVGWNHRCLSLLSFPQYLPDLNLLSANASNWGHVSLWRATFSCVATRGAAPFKTSPCGVSLETMCMSCYSLAQHLSAVSWVWKVDHQLFWCSGVVGGPVVTCLSRERHQTDSWWWPSWAAAAAGSLVKISLKANVFTRCNEY